MEDKCQWCDLVKEGRYFIGPRYWSDTSWQWRHPFLIAEGKARENGSRTSMVQCESLNMNRPDEVLIVRR